MFWITDAIKTTQELNLQEKWRCSTHGSLFTFALELTNKIRCQSIISKNLISCLVHHFIQYSCRITEIIKAVCIPTEHFSRTALSVPTQGTANHQWQIQQATSPSLCLTLHPNSLSKQSSTYPINKQTNTQNPTPYKCTLSHPLYGSSPSLSLSLVGLPFLR